MKILIDAGVGRKVADELTASGHDVVNAVNLGSGITDLICSNNHKSKDA